MNTGFLLTDIIALFSIAGFALLPLVLQKLRTIKTNTNA